MTCSSSACASVSSRTLLAHGDAALAQLGNIEGVVVDPQGNVVVHVPVSLVDRQGKSVQQTVTNDRGQFSFRSMIPGEYVLKIVVTGFKSAIRTLAVGEIQGLTIDIRLKIAAKRQVVTVTADINEGNALAPDPAQRVFIREETLDANPGRPGAPVSVPGLPIETASGGIKAPQYFAPGVAGDHGEPIAQYVRVGSYLLPNNLSANAHGNGYADPNILAPSTIESVQTDGGLQCA